MVRSARKQGCRIGTTTNGMLCDRQMLEQMVKEQVSVVCFSLAGTTTSQDAIRQGTSLQTVIRAVRSLHAAKKRLGASLPKIHVAHLWLRSQRDAVKDLPVHKRWQRQQGRGPYSQPAGRILASLDRE